LYRFIIVMYKYIKAYK